MKRSPRLRAMLFTLKTKLRLLSRSHGDFAEDTQKPWCNGEFEKSAREDKAEHKEISMLDAEMQEETDQIAALEEEIKPLAGENADLDKSVVEATEQRKEEHAEYLEGAQLAQTAIALIEKAKQRLVKFYNPVLYKAPPKTEMTMEEKIIAAGSASLLQLRGTRALKAA